MTTTMMMLIGIIVLAHGGLFLYFHTIKAETVKKIEMLSENALEVTPSEFFEIRNKSIGKKHISTQYAFAGVYILYNHTKNMYYVGQGKNVFQRVNAHFTGHGNGDVYADYKYGDSFTIKMIRLDGSGYDSLNDLERNTIKVYNAYSNGYNKTRGNRR